MSATLTPDRLTAVDLTDLPNANMSALRREAIRRGISMAQLVADEMHDLSRRLVASQRTDAPPKATDIIRAATEAQPGHHPLPTPEGQN